MYRIIYVTDNNVIEQFLDANNPHILTMVALCDHRAKRVLVHERLNSGYQLILSVNRK
jgi:hypothetical protein